MAIIKCKMCGGDLVIKEGSTVCECEYCGTRQTVPSADNEKKLTLFNRAGRLLRACEFDKAAGVFETIVADFPQEAEAYWGLVLCKYGIEYVDDPATGKKIPTCHRSSFESVLDDANFEQACENTDAVARRVYRDEARQIEDLRQAILSVSGKEEPYDVFISYKETDENGNRTLDSVIAQDIYKELTGEGYRVFFSRISLESKLGTEYEPYIFAALNSAKVMIVVGTDYENFDSVWVKNEWSRFLKLIAAGQKKTLIPVFKSMDAYDMPKEFAKLSAQDMGKIGAMQDLVRGVEKIAGKKKDSLYEGKNSGPNIDAMLDRGTMALEDGEWAKAKSLFDQILNIDSHNAEAYLGLVMAENEFHSRNDILEKYPLPDSTLHCDKNLKRAKQFSNVDLKEWFEKLDYAVKQAEELERESQRIAEEKAKAEKDKLVAYRKKITNSTSKLIAILDDDSIIGVSQDGTVSSTTKSPVEAWTNIAGVSGSMFAVGLRGDGTVIAATGVYEKEIANWNDIVDVSASNVVLGLKSDGTLIATQYFNPKSYSGQSEVSGWKDIVAVAAGNHRSVGLKADGTVVATKYSESEDKTHKWTNIIAVSSGPFHVLGLKLDGSVVADFSAPEAIYTGQCEVSSWSDIVAISAGRNHSVGLKVDGTVVATKYTGPNQLYKGQCEVSSWTDIVAVFAGAHATVGLKSDGTVVATGQYEKEVCKWRLFDNIESIEEGRKEAIERAKAEHVAAKEKAAKEREAVKESLKAALEEERASLTVELPSLKGIFAKTKKAKIEARLAEIEKELKTLG